MIYLMKVRIKVFIDDEKCKLEDLTNEYLKWIEEDCKRIRLRRFYKTRNNNISD